MIRVNDYGQPIGDAIPDWQSPEVPSADVLLGTFCRLERLRIDVHGPKLFACYQDQPELWTYLGAEPFSEYEDYRAWLLAHEVRGADIPYVILNPDGAALGHASYMRIAADVGSIEVGNVCFSRELQRTAAATEAMFLMMKYAFDTLGYRRYEWKCDALNEPSRKAAKRLGFSFEGVFRNARVYKGRTRDTAWFSIIESEWPERKDAFERWLAPDNFDVHGRQKMRLKIPTDSP